MNLEMNEAEVGILREVVERRMDELLRQLAAADTLSFKESLREEEKVLDGLFSKLGCTRPERSMERACAIDADGLEGLGPEEVG